MYQPPWEECKPPPEKNRWISAFPDRSTAVAVLISAVPVRFLTGAALISAFLIRSLPVAALISAFSVPSLTVAVRVVSAFLLSAFRFFGVYLFA